MTRTIWDVLAIPETQDIGAIRSAYARALKTIDVDAESQRYIELRNARDQAVYEARVAAAKPAVDPIGIDDQGLAGIPPGTFEDHVTALASLLMPECENAAPVDAMLARGHFDALLRNSRMEEVAFAARAEAQLSELIAMTLPRSAALIEPAIAAFGWRDAVNVDTPPAVAAICDAAAAMQRGEPLADPPPLEGASQADEIDPNVTARAAAYASLVALLVPHEEEPAPLTSDEQAAARQHFEILLTDVRMEVVTFRVGAEAQLAQLIAYAIPRSDCIIESAIDFFGWRTEQDRIDQSDAIAFILARDRGLRFRTAVLRPEHPHHAAWTELTTPLGQKPRFFGSYVNPVGVDNLLAAIRFEQPLLERELDPGRVAMWDRKLAKRAPIASPPGKASVSWGRWVWLGILVMVGVTRVFSNLNGGAQDPYNAIGYSAPPITTADTASNLVGGQSSAVEDIGPVLAEIGGRDLTLTALHFSNQALANELEAQWASARAQRGDITDFQRSIEKLLLARIASVILTTSDADLVVQYQALRLNELRKRTSVPADCVALGEPGKLAINDVPSDFSDGQKQLYGKILAQAYRRETSSPPINSTAVSATVASVATKIGTTPERAAQILAGKAGSDSDRCIARIAELEVLLALPRAQAVTLLRML